MDRGHAADADRAAARRLPAVRRGRVRFLPRFIADPEIPALLRRADRAGPSLPGDRAVRRPLRRPRVRQADGARRRRRLLARSAASRARRGSCRPATPPRSRAPCASCSPTRPSASAWRQRPGRRSRARSPGTRSPRAPSTSTSRCSRRADNPGDEQSRSANGLLGRGRWLLVHTHLTYPLALAALERLRGRRDAAARRPSRRTPTGLAGHRRPRRGGGDRAQARQRLELDYPARAAGDDRRLRRLQRPHRRARPGGRGRPRPRSAARRQDRRPERGGRARRRASCSPSATPTPTGSRTRCASCVAPFADPDVGYVCGQVRFLDADGDNEEGAYWRYEMWVRELESGQGGVTAGNGGIYAVRRDCLRVPRPVAQPRPQLALPARQARASARSTRPAPGPRRSWSPTIERRVRAQAPDDARDSGTSSSPTGWRTRAATRRCSRYRDLLAPAAALRLADPAPRRCCAANLRLLRRGRLYGLPCSPSSASAAAPRCPRRRVRLAAASPATTRWSPPRSRSAPIDRLRDGPPAAWEKSEGTR